MSKESKAGASRRMSQLLRIPKTAELVASEVRRRIIQNELSEGDKLPSEPALIEEFGISRPTMREAIRILETEGLISVARGSRGGARVHLPDVDVVSRYAELYLQSRKTTARDLHQARLIVEPPGARLLAKQHSSSQITELKNCISEIEANIGDRIEYGRHSAEFHLKIIEGSGNETLTLLGHMMHGLWSSFVLNVIGSSYDVEAAKLDVRSDKKLVSLIEAGDQDGAEKHVTNHLIRTGKIIFKICDPDEVVEFLS